MNRFQFRSKIVRATTTFCSGDASSFFKRTGVGKFHIYAKCPICRIVYKSRDYRGVIYNHKCKNDSL